jgi:hypothetical protein
LDNHGTIILIRFAAGSQFLATGLPENSPDIWRFRGQYGAWEWLGQEEISVAAGKS